MTVEQTLRRGIAVQQPPTPGDNKHYAACNTPAVYLPLDYTRILLLPYSSIHPVRLLNVGDGIERLPGQPTVGFIRCCGGTWTFCAVALPYVPPILP